MELHDGDYITFGRYAGKSLIFKSGLEPQLKIEKVNLDRDRITIGRDPTNDVVIDHPVVSKKHAEIVKQDGRVILVDLGSTNGTFVNGIKVKRHQLQELDRIVIGPSELHFSGESLSHASDTRVVRLDSVGVTFQVTDRTSGKPKLLLDDISLVVKPKELIGLLGPSGAGKTTLMNALNGFVKPTSGHVLYNGEDLYRNLEALKSTIGFVPQEDIMHRQLSVRKCLYYAAKLRLPEDLSDEEVNRRVEEMLETLKLDPQRWDNPVFTLSGGQRKRVSLGIELLPKPGVLFLDEPTAGLDPRTQGAFGTPLCCSHHDFDVVHPPTADCLDHRGAIMDSGLSTIRNLLYIVLVLVVLSILSGFYVATQLARNSDELASLRLLLQKQMMGTAVTQAEELEKRMDTLNQSAAGIDGKMQKAQDDFVARMQVELPKRVRDIDVELLGDAFMVAFICT